MKLRHLIWIGSVGTVLFAVSIGLLVRWALDRRDDPFVAVKELRDLEEVAELYSNLDDPNLSTKNEGPLLIFVSQFGIYELADILLKKGADRNIQNEFGQTALHEVTRQAAVDAETLHATRTYAELIDLLLEYGADPTIREQTTNRSPLDLAIEHDNLDVLMQLLPEYERRGGKSEYNDTLLHVAADEGAIKIAQFLLQRGANPLAKNLFDKTPVDFARQRGHAELLALFQNTSEID